VHTKEVENTCSNDSIGKTRAQKLWTKLLTYLLTYLLAELQCSVDIELCRVFHSQEQICNTGT